jgi:hypothetical protein
LFRVITILEVLGLCDHALISYRKENLLIDEVGVLYILGVHVIGTKFVLKAKRREGGVTYWL